MIRSDTPYLPADVNYDKERLTVLDKHFKKMIEKNEILSANYCLSRDGKIFANAAIGKLSYREDDNRQLQTDTIQWIASITKLFCAVAIFKLAEDGMLRLDQTVGEIIDEFKEPPFNKMNIAHLLSHTSGMYSDPGSFENKYFKSPWYFIENMEGTNWIEAALSAGMYKKPGEEWAYCSFGYVILGEVITRVSGMFAHDYIVENIVKPCGLKDTGFTPTREQVLRMNVQNKRREERMLSFLNGEKQDDSIWSKIPSTGGGMFSTAYDLNKFGMMLLNNGTTYEGTRIIGRKAVEKMTSFYLKGDIKDYCWNAGGVPRLYGLGPDMRYNLTTFYTKGTYFHEGAGACCLIIDPFEKLVASWFVPFTSYTWHAHALFNVAAIIWSGLK
jgi:CubicO group peptidase (beta-lactamase class C family)